MRPIVGITTRRLPASAMGPVPAGVAHTELDGLVTDYARAVHEAGGVPIMLTRFADPSDVIGIVDAVLLSGGEDVEPSRYGGTVDEHATAHDAGRDAFEVDLVGAALDANIPVLGICRGTQLLNVALGGSLVPHVADVDGFSHHQTGERPEIRRHSVRLREGSRLSEIYADSADGDGEIRVNSFHHQAVHTPGRGLRVSAVAFDGTIEGVEMEDRPVVGVQWHPEWHEGCDSVIAWLVVQARTQKAGISQ